MRGNVVQNIVGSEVISGSFVGDGTQEFPVSIGVSKFGLMEYTGFSIFTTDCNGAFPDIDDVGALISFCGLITDDLMNSSQLVGNVIWVDMDPVRGPFFGTHAYLYVSGSYTSPPLTLELQITPVFKDGATYHYVIW